MVRKFIWFLVLVMLFSGCSSEEIEEEVFVEENHFFLDINLGFIPNIDPEYDSSLTNPGPGLRSFVENSSVNISAIDSDKYVFGYWKVKPSRSEEFFVYDTNFSFNMTEDTVINAYFGCADDVGCKNKYVCENNTCIPAGFKFIDVIIAISKLENEKDVASSEGLEKRLEQERYVHVKTDYFENVNASLLSQKILVAIFEQTAFVIRGENVTNHDELFLLMENMVRLEGIPPSKIKKINSEEILSHDLYDLFLG